MVDKRYKRLGKNTLLVFIGRAGSYFIGFLMLPLYTRWLTPSEYGTVDIITVYSSILLSFVTCCLADAIFVFPKNADNEEKKQYYTSGLSFILIAFFVCALVLYGIKSFAFLFGGEGSFIGNIWYIYWMMVSAAFQSYTQQFTRSIDKMVTYSVTGILQALLVAIFSFLLVRQYKLGGYIIAIVATNIIAAFFSMFHSGSYKYVAFNSIDKGPLFRLLRYGIPLIPNSIMWWMINGINRPIIEKIVGLSALGVFAVANKFPSILSMCSSIFSNSWNITVLEEYGKEDFNSFFNRTAQMIMSLLIIFGCLVCLFSKLIVRIFASSEFFDAWQYIPLLTLSILFLSFSDIVSGVFVAQKKSKYFFYSSLVGALASIALTIPLVYLFGLLGACVAVNISFLSILVARIRFAWASINQINLKYYITSSILYLLVVVAITIDVNVCINIALSCILMGYVFYNNYDRFLSFFTLIKKRINN